MVSVAGVTRPLTEIAHGSAGLSVSGYSVRT